MRRYFPLVFAFFLLPACGLAQTGFPPFGSFDTSQFDAVNRQNLNVNFAIPIVSAPGRGISFSFAIIQDSLFWRKAGNS